MRRQVSVWLAGVMCGVLPWWKVTLPSEIGQATVRDSSGSQQMRSLFTPGTPWCSSTPSRCPPSMKCMQPLRSSTSCIGIQHVRHCSARARPQ